MKDTTMDELFESTVEKMEYLKREGYNVVEMWECDIRRELKEDEDMKHYFDHYHLTDPLEPRDALYGGRTMFESGIFSPPRVTCPLSSHDTRPGLGFKRSKRFVALPIIVLAIGPNTSASGSDSSRGNSIFSAPIGGGGGGICGGGGGSGACGGGGARGETCGRTWGGRTRGGTCGG